MHEPVTIRRVDPDDAPALAEPLASLLIECVDGGASVGFMAPLSQARALEFWRGVLASVQRGERILLVAQQGERIVGTVQLITALPDNQPHRGDVAKMLVATSVRRGGIARRLLLAAEDAARAAGKHVLVLDAVTDGPAARLYASAGWQRVGEIPKFALMPDGPFCSTTYFHRQL